MSERNCRKCGGTGTVKVLVGVLHDTDSADEHRDARQQQPCPNGCLIPEAKDTELIRLREENERLKRQQLDREQEEAAACPEDVGAVEFVKVPQAGRDSLRTLLETAREKMQRVQDAHLVPACKIAAHKPLRVPMCPSCQLDARIEESTDTIRQIEEGLNAGTGTHPMEGVKA